jgi:hypothetical protein
MEGPLDEAQPTGPTAPPLHSLVSAAAVPLFLAIAAPRHRLVSTDPPRVQVRELPCA